VNPFENMAEDQIREFLERLTYHAYCKIVHLRWRGFNLKQGAATPGGIEPQDVAAQAIVDVIDGTRRYDPLTHPNLLRFLKGVVDSQVSNLVRSAENRKARRFPSPAEADGEPCEYEVRDPWPDPADMVADEESMELFQKAIRAALKDDTLALEVLRCLDADITKPSEMAEVLGRDVHEINNAQKRLRNKVSKAIMKMKGGEEHGRRQRVR
jgi:DNA-directed RNA polymerase specialized sigma24 family protein